MSETETKKDSFKEALDNVCKQREKNSEVQRLREQKEYEYESFKNECINALSYMRGIRTKIINTYNCEGYDYDKALPSAQKFYYDLTQELLNDDDILKLTMLNALFDDLVPNRVSLMEQKLNQN